jgi:hypothetical protein
LAQNASGDITIQGYKSYLLQSVETTHPAWVRIYGTPLARSADSSRTINEDPSASTQLLCEVITDVSVLKAQLSPGVLGYNYDDPVSSNIYLSVKNLDSSSHEITVNLSLVKLEA